MRHNLLSLHLATALFATAALTLTAAPVAAAVPQFAQVEGVLLSAGGGPAADGSYAVVFGIYAQQAGGTPVWTESASLNAKSGQFSWQLGSKTPLSAATLSLPAAWLGLAVGSDPELPRQPIGASPFALRAAVAEALDCSGCLKASALEAAVLQPYAKSADLSGYAKATDLSGYAKSADLGAYAKVSELGDYVKAASLSAVAASGSFNDLKDKPKLADVANTGNYGDLNNKPVMAKIGSSCGTGLYLKGFKADGALDCAAIELSGDLIDEISNGLIFNQFTDKFSGGLDIAIPDGNGAGISDAISFPDIGVAQAVWIDVDLLNSDVSKIKIELFAPGQANPYILYDGSKSGQTLKTAFNKDTPIAAGNIDGDWIGKNAKGTWSIIVKDPLKNQLASSVDGKFSWSMSVKTMSNKKIQIKGDLIVDGQIIGMAASKGSLGSRIQHKSGKFFGFDDVTDSWRTFPGIVLPFIATGGPLQISFSAPMYAGSHRSCRPLIDGLPAGVYSVSDTTYKWQDGLTYTYESNGTWRMWNNTRVYDGVAAGNHLVSFECLNDSAGQGGPRMGHENMVSTAHVVPYDPVASAEVKVYQVASIPNQALGQTNVWFNVNGLSTKFMAQGGPVRISISVPSSGGSHSSCKPMIDGVSPGKDEGDDLTYTWQEGITYVGGQWNVWNRTRVYNKVTAGEHTLTVQCLTDSAPSTLTNSRISAHAAVYTYKPAADGNTTAKVYSGGERKQYPISNSASWTTLNGNSAGTGINAIPFVATGGPVEIGISLPLNSGAHTTCRALVDGAPVAGEPDDTSTHWQEGIVYTGGRWNQWDRIRVYRTIKAGNHTLGVACHGDSGGTTAGHPNMMSHIWAVAYNP